MSQSKRLADLSPGSRWPLAAAVLALSLLVGGASAQTADQDDQDDQEAAQEEDFGADDFGTAAPPESPQRIDLGSSNSGAVITPAQAAQGASPETISEGVGEDEDVVDGEAQQEQGGDGVFVPTEEIRVDTAIAFPVDI